MVTNLGIRRLAAQDIPEMRKLFRATVLTVNSKDYTKEEVEDWASCGDSVEHWKELLAKNECLSTRTGKEKVWQPCCFRKWKRWLVDMGYTK